MSRQQIDDTARAIFHSTFRQATYTLTDPLSECLLEYLIMQQLHYDGKHEARRTPHGDSSILGYGGCSGNMSLVRQVAHMLLLFQLCFVVVYILHIV